MQTAKNATQSVKEAASNVAASAKSGMDKTKAIVQEKGERMTAHDPMEKEMATEKKEERINQAEFDKQQARQHNTVAKGAHSYSTTGATGQPTGTHQMSALPGHGTGQPTGQVVEGTVPSHPLGTDRGTGTTTAGHNTKVGGGGTNQGYGTGGAFR